MSTARHTDVGPPFTATVVVGSLGALQSFQSVLGRLPASFPAAVVFDLHRQKGFGITEQLLARRAAMPVKVAAEGVALEPSVVYLAPDDRQLTIGDDGLMSISQRATGTGHPSADSLLASAAHGLGTRLIAVVLSGRLDGGARGVREVKHLGGRVLVEDPSTAAAPSMPSAALATGCVDFALPPDGIADALLSMCGAVGAAELFRVRLNAAVAG